MRPIALTAAGLLFLAGAAAPAYAGGGLPTLASLQVGAHLISVQGDSPSLHVGLNTLTVDRGNLDADHTISLSLLDPTGTLVAVPLQNLTVLEGPEVEHSHGTSEDEHGTAGATDGHSDAGTAAGTSTSGATHTETEAENQAAAHAAHADAPSVTDHAHADAEADHAQTDSEVDPAESEAPTDHSHAGTGLGAANLPFQQTSQVRGQVKLDQPGLWTLVVTVDGHGEVMSEQVTIPAKQGGPSPLYLGATGTAMGGTILYGLIRRRQGVGRE